MSCCQLFRYEKFGIKSSYIALSLVLEAFVGILVWQVVIPFDLGFIVWIVAFSSILTVETPWIKKVSIWLMLWVQEKWWVVGSSILHYSPSEIQISRWVGRGWKEGWYLYFLEMILSILLWRLRWKCDTLAFGAVEHLMKLSLKV